MSNDDLNAELLSKGTLINNVEYAVSQSTESTEFVNHKNNKSKKSRAEDNSEILVKIEQSINKLNRKQLVDNLKNIINFNTIKKCKGRKEKVYPLSLDKRRKALLMIEKLGRLSDDEVTVNNAMCTEPSDFSNAFTELTLFETDTENTLNTIQNSQILNDEILNQVINNGKEITQTKEIVQQKLELIETNINRLNQFLPIQNEKLDKIFDNTRDIRTIISNQVEMVKEVNSIKKIIEETRTSKEFEPVLNGKNNNNSGHFQTYAEALKAPPTTFFIKPAKNETMTDLKNIIKNFDTKICPTKIYYGDKSIKIRCANTQDKENLENELAKIRLTIIEAKPIKSKIIIFNIPENLEDNFIISKMCEISKLENSKENVQIVSKLGSRKFENSVHLVLEMPKKNSFELLKKGFIYLGFKKFLLQKYITMKRCTKCQSLDHTLKNCSSKFSICCYCGINHDANTNCRNKPPTCINCKKFKHIYNIHHTANDLKCPVFKNKYYNDGTKY